ncbi:helix-turn-helix domain-containing protein [Asticcacaulis sp. AND118]|uniref:helix-turn-helix domain-containing protein n=1 Tax=Asticcacaulis sp. AND118 TaxID=2840468 RepID=UPI001CFFC58E|nr:helix-turn-helix transcriptional regulator [Asticcacaulis sp. AND118]UDF04665.1 helix-turn-helix domain-containing protein [Asticcacaulis sp. AND118]
MDKALIYGQALAQLRMRARLSQDKAAEAAGTSQPTWARYESGDSRAFYDRLAVRSKIVRALGFSLRDLDAEAEALTADMAYVMAEETADGVAASAGVDLGALNRPTLKRVQITTDDLSPYLRAGGFAIYDTARLPKAGDGVIVHLRDGRLLPRFYLRQATELWVERMSAEGEGYVRQSETLNMARVAGVYPIVLRGDTE